VPAWQDAAMPRPAPDEGGLEYLRRIFVEGGRAAPIGELVGMSFVSADHGHVVFGLTPEERHYNPIGTVHGGIAATLLDSAMGCAVHSTLPPGVAYTTAEIKVSYVRAMTATTGPVVAEGRVIHAGSRMATAEGSVRDAAGALYAHGTTTCLVFPMRT
jgi:uncharacterized protein (TIGR00369 family)